MSVSAAVTLFQQRGLVQRNDLDPSQFLKWGSTITADATLGTLTGICTVPADLACLFIGISAFGVSDYAGDAVYQVVEDGVSVFSEVGRNTAIVNSIAFFPCYEPPRVIWTADAIACQVVADNVDGDNINVQAFAFGWDKQVARNLPQRFLWPAMPI